MLSKEESLCQIAYDITLAHQALSSLCSMLAEASDLAEIGVTGPGLAGLLEGIRSRLDMGTSELLDLAGQLGLHDVVHRATNRYGASPGPVAQ